MEKMEEMDGLSEEKKIEKMFQDYEQIRETQAIKTSISRRAPLIRSWHQFRGSQGLNPGRNCSHTCTPECTIDVIATLESSRLYGCRESGTTHECFKHDNDRCSVRYTDTAGEEFCVFSNRLVSVNIVTHAWSNPNTNRPCYRTVVRDSLFPSTEFEGLGNLGNGGNGNLGKGERGKGVKGEEGKGGKGEEGLNLSTPLQTPAFWGIWGRGGKGFGEFGEGEGKGLGNLGKRKARIGVLKTPIRTSLPEEFRGLEFSEDGVGDIELCTPFALPEEEGEFWGKGNLGKGNWGKGMGIGGMIIGQTPTLGRPVAATPQRRISSGIALEATLSKSLPDYTHTTLKGKRRKTVCKNKASNPKREVKRNEWAEDVKKRAREHLRQTHFWGKGEKGDLGKRGKGKKKSEWDEEGEFEEGEFGEFKEGEFGGICLFTVDVPLYRGYSREVISEEWLPQAQRNKVAWMGGLFRIKSGSEIEYRTDGIISDLLWDNNTKEQVYRRRLEDSKRAALSEIEAYVKTQISAEPTPLLPNYYHMCNRWMEALDLPEPMREKVDVKRKTLYRLLVLMLWAFVWEYIEVPAWRAKCRERVQKLEASHAGVISPNMVNIPPQAGVSHIQFTIGVLYTLRQDGLRLGKELLIEPDEWLQKMLPAPIDLCVNLADRYVGGKRTCKRQQQNGKGVKGGAVSFAPSRKWGKGGKGKGKRGRGIGGRGNWGGPRAGLGIGGIGGWRNGGERKKRKKTQRKGFGRGKRVYSQSNVTEGRNYVKKALLKLAQEGHTENIREAVRIVFKQTRDSVESFQGF